MSSRRRNKFVSAHSESHFLDLMDCLALESAAEVERIAERRTRKSRQQLEQTGEVIFDLVVADQIPGLGQRQLVTLVRRTQGQLLPWHRIKVGTPVVVFDQQTAGDQQQSGVVCRVRRESLQVALDRALEGKSFCLETTADEMTRLRQQEALQTVMNSRGRLGRLRDILMGQTEPRFGALPQIDFLGPLNSSQREAVRFALSAEDLAIIHGPPGTGKTTTVVELIVQAVRRGDRVLAVAPSNTAVDNLLERLIAVGQRVVRLGHPARISESLRDFSLDALVERHENTIPIRDLIREAEALFRQSDKWTRAKRVKGERQQLRGEARKLLQHARQLEAAAVHDTLERADVVCATTSINDELLGDRWYDLAVIDEACQSTEPGCWVPLLRAEKVVLAGDHQQLPPTILSDEAARRGLAKSLLERQIELYGDSVNRLLSVQYRMHQQIMKFSSEVFYQNRLQADESVKKHLLKDLSGVQDNLWTDSPVEFIDTAGAGYEDEIEEEGSSKLNRGEAGLIVELVKRLLQSGLQPRHLAVIAPYSAQVRLLRTMVYQGQGWESLVSAPDRITELEIDTVDGFQGREKEGVLLSLVTSNSRQEIGFLADVRRMNVALTRARRKLIVVGDSATLGVHDFYQRFFQYVDSIEAYHSIWNYRSDRLPEWESL
jgi:ATP-dependent RNA/DNA helicase IGHMBP2